MESDEKEYPRGADEVIDEFFRDYLKLDPGLLNSLHIEDDWSFFIKLHALLEITLNHLIINTLRDKRLYATIARLDTSDPTRGKLAFIKALGLLTKDERSLIKRFSEIRNNLVHDPQNLSFTFEEYLKQLDAPERKSVKDAICNTTLRLVTGLTNERMDQMFTMDARASLFVAVTLIMRQAYFRGKFRVVADPDLVWPSESNPKKL